MADQAHLAALKQGVDAWNAWRPAHAGVRPDLSGAGLRGLDLSDADLSRADLREADLRGAILRGATLTGANLAGANVFKAILDDADLAGANLIGARFVNCAQLVAARNWAAAFRDPDLACGAPAPEAPASTVSHAPLDVEPQQVVLGEGEAADGRLGFLDCRAAGASCIGAARSAARSARWSEVG